MLKKFILIFILNLAATNAWALVKIQFFGMQTMLNVIGHAPDSPSDSDAVELFNLMNVPIQHSFLGPGKSIVTDDQKLNFVCGVQGNENKCSIIIQQGPETKADPFNKMLNYEVTGTAATFLDEKFLRPGQPDIHFVSADQKLSLDVSAGHFRLHFQPPGSNH